MPGCTFPGGPSDALSVLPQLNGVAQAPATVRFLYIGDSLAVGVGDGAGLGGARGRLHAKYWTDALPFCIDPVGALSDVASTNSYYWGNSGATISSNDAAGPNDCGPSVNPADARVRPRVILVHLGVNDVVSAPTAVTAAGDMESLLSYIDAQSQAAWGDPDTRVVLCKIAGVTNATTDGHIATFNDLLDGVAANRVAAGQRVTVADVYGGVPINASTPGLFADPVHWNATGHQAVADYLDPFVRRAAGYSGS